MIRVGIECESIEGESWGVGRIIKKLLEEIANNSELQKEFKFFLYFKSSIPNFLYLKNPIFTKRVVWPRFLPSSFSLYYYVFLPIRLYFGRLDMVFFPNYMLPIIFRGKSLVILTEDVYYEARLGQLPSRYKLAYKIFSSWAASHATKIMAISENSKTEVSKFFGIEPEKIVVASLGVDRPKTQQGNLKDVSNYILYVGQAFPRRHLKETMLAFEKIGKDFPGLNFIAIGYDKYNPPIIKQLSDEINMRLGRNAITYKERVSEDELSRLYLGAKLLIYISSREAFGLPPLEALAHQTPPVVAQGNLTREIFGENAFFVPDPESVGSIAATITDALKNYKKYTEIIANSEKILAKFTWPNFTENFLKIVKNIANQWKKHPSF